MTNRTPLTDNSRAKFPQRLLLALVAITMMAIVWMAWGFYEHSQDEVEEETARVATKRLRGRILHYEEAVTMSTKAAAVSGDTKWVQRSLEFEPKLKVVFEEAMTFFPPEYIEASTAGWNASDKLEKLRKEALELVRAGNLKQAQDIMFGEEYSTARAIYQEITAEVCTMSHYWILIEYLKERVIYLDEALTMSAFMAAYTGDPTWQEQYHKYDVQYVHAMEEVLLLVPPALQEVAGKSKPAADILFAKEAETFDLIKENKLPEAQAVLLSDVYQEQKSIYAQALREFSDELARIPENIIQGERDESSRHVIEVVFVITLCMIIGIFFTKLFKDWQEALVHKNMELKDLNKTLDEKVQERTGQLEKQHKALEIANKDLRKNEEAVRAMYKDIKKVHDEYKQTQIQLIQSEKLASIGQLAAGIAHEINNPIGFVGSNIQTMTKYVQDIEKFLGKIEDLRKCVRLNDFDKAKESINEIDAIEEGMDLKFIFKDTKDLLKESQSGIDRIRKIVMDLKTFARKDKDESSLINLQGVLDEVLNILNNELKYSCEIVKEYDPIPLVKCNPQKLGQVFMNLLLNAKQAIEGKGKIIIHTYKKDDQVCVEITDTGKGIPPKIMSDIFLPFFTTKPVGLGTGLGLSISYDIVKAYQGEIRVQSEVGKGSTFTVVMPIRH